MEESQNVKNDNLWLIFPFVSSSKILTFFSGISPLRPLCPCRKKQKHLRAELVPLNPSVYLSFRFVVYVRIET